MNGWRLWRVTQGGLQSPTAARHLAVPTMLPDDAVMVGACPYGHENVPALGCGCGVCFVASAWEMNVWASAKLRVDPTLASRCALTFGVAQGRILAREPGPLRPLDGPTYRAESFRVRGILADGGSAKGFATRYGVKVYRGPLTVTNMVEIERRFR